MEHGTTGTTDQVFSDVLNRFLRGYYFYLPYGYPLPFIYGSTILHTMYIHTAVCRIHQSVCVHTRQTLGKHLSAITTI